MTEQPEGQLPNTAGIIEDPAEIPTAPVNPESVELPFAEAAVEASYNEDEVKS